MVTRSTVALIVLLALVISTLLSLFLAQTIVRPLRELVQAAVRVRQGRDRQVEVPRLPQRRDEIGMLARSISDMTAALRQRIDAVEHFAADVAHEIKNPLASLRSATESLGKVEDPALRAQLLEIATHDVRRIDRLVTEIWLAARRGGAAGAADPIADPMAERPWARLPAALARLGAALARLGGALARLGAALARLRTPALNWLAGRLPPPVVTPAPPPPPAFCWGCALLGSLSAA